MPEISLIIPVYNGQNYIQKCFQSILNQSYNDYEVIFINNKSTDDSFIILNQLEHNYSFVKVINESNQGAAFARNAGLDNSKGNYICFIDIDDTLEKDYLKTLYENLINNNSDLSMIGINKIENNTSTPELLYHTNKFFNTSEDILMLQAGCYCNALTNFETSFIGMGTPWDKMYKASIIKNNNLRFNTLLKTGEDTFFVWNYFNFVKSFVFDKSCLYNYVVYTQSLSRRFVELETFFDTIKVFYESYKDEYSQITKDSIYYTIFRHFLSLLKKHFANKEKNYTFKLIRSELQQVLASKEMQFSLSNIPLKILSRKEKLIFKLLNFPNLFSLILNFINHVL